MLTANLNMKNGKRFQSTYSAPALRLFTSAVTLDKLWKRTDFEKPGGMKGEQHWIYVGCRRDLCAFDCCSSKTNVLMAKTLSARKLAKTLFSVGCGWQFSFQKVYVSCK